MVRKLHRTGITLRENTYGKKTQTKRGHLQNRDIHEIMIHTEWRHTRSEDVYRGGNIYGNGNIRNRDYTEKGDGTHMDRGLTRSGDTHGGGTYTVKKTIRNGNYTEKRREHI